jgi:hypothetical protein
MPPQASVRQSIDHSSHSDRKVQQTFFHFFGLLRAHFSISILHCSIFNALAVIERGEVGRMARVHGLKMDDWRLGIQR